VHGLALPTVPLTDSLPEITVIVGADPSAPGKHLIDIPALRARQPGIVYADLIVTTPDRPGQQLLGRLENAPDAQISIDFDHPTHWLA
jgi:hypothetical protein